MKEKEYIHIVGSRQQQELSFHATAENLLEGCRFNDSLHSLSPEPRLHIRKGVYFFRTHEEADRHRMECLTDAIAATAKK